MPKLIADALYLVAEVADNPYLAEKMVLTKLLLSVADIVKQGPVAEAMLIDFVAKLEARLEEIDRQELDHRLDRSQPNRGRHGAQAGDADANR